jgi:hypothetical protein
MLDRAYSIGEMNNHLFPMIRDMVASPELPKEHRLNVAESNLWLLPLVEATNQKENWEQITRHGKVSARLFGTVGKTTIAIDYPREAWVVGLCEGLPLGFHFVLKNDTFVWSETKHVK